MKRCLSGMIMSTLVLALASGCGSSRDVQVSGTVEGATASSTNPITVLFYEPSGSGDAGAAAGADLKLIDSITVDKAGPFDATISMDGNTLTVVAVVDTDQSDACTDGEAWGETSVPVDSTNAVQVNVAVAAHEKCPAVPTE
jgi:hypothetical protein